MGRVDRLMVQIRTLPVPKAEPASGQAPEKALRDACQRWVNQLWAEKDALISQVLVDKNTKRHHQRGKPKIPIK
jgi:hypothetical protein